MVTVAGTEAEDGSGLWQPSTACVYQMCGCGQNWAETWLYFSRGCSQQRNAGAVQEMLQIYGTGRQQGGSMGEVLACVQMSPPNAAGF